MVDHPNRGRRFRPTAEPPAVAESVEEDVLRSRLVSDILDRTETVVGAPRTVYAELVDQLRRTSWENCFREGVIEGMMIAADIVGPPDRD